MFVQVSRLLDLEDSIFMVCDRMNRASSVDQFEGTLTLLCGLCSDMQYLENEELSDVRIRNGSDK